MVSPLESMRDALGAWECESNQADAADGRNRLPVLHRGKATDHAAAIEATTRHNNKNKAMNLLAVRNAFVVMPLCLATACGLHHGDANVPLPADQLVATLNQSFQSADAATKDTVRKIAEEIQKHDIAEAYNDTKLLAAQSDLSTDQRITAIRAGRTIGQELQDAAQNGDTNAVETLRAVKGSH